MEKETRSFLMKVYGLTGLGLLLSVVFGCLAHGASLGLAASLVSLVIGLVLIVAVCLTRGLLSAGLFLVFASLEGVGLSHLLARFIAKSPGVVAMAAGLTALIVFGLSAYVIKSKKDFSFLGAGLFVALIILVVAGLVALFIPGLQILVAAAGAIIFSMYILYDTSQMINGGYEADEYGRGAVSIYLDIVNLFLDLLQILNFLND